MNDIVIRVENLSKLYRIGRAQQRHDTLRDAVVAGLRAPWERLSSFVRRPSNGDERPGTNDEAIWALKNVSFEAQRGEVVGIIGRNGAGKSTLLKILSRITEPTEGRAVIKGRVGSLLEVGTGFHPELTGRENIYLNGAILGMRRAEIDRKFDEIVAFAEIEKFLDTPVKRYSSGMYVRLAFAVAAHLEPEILLVDEVLAVGDAAFQKKCLGKMGDVAKEGRTVVFVSHNMGAVQALCERGIFLQDGTVLTDSTVAEAVGVYLRTLEQAAPKDLSQRIDRSGVGQVRLTRVKIHNGNRLPSSILTTGHPAYFTFYVDGKLFPGVSCIFTFYNRFGLAVASFNSAVHSPEDLHDLRLDRKFVCELDELLLVPGRYRINVGIMGNGEWQDHIEAAAVFDVEEGQLRGRPVTSGGRAIICMPHRWVVPE